MRIPIVLERILSTEGGMTCWRRRLWSRNSNSSRRSHDLPGRLGKLTIGRSGARERTEKVEGPEWDWFKASETDDTVRNWKAGCLGTSMSGLAEGPTEKGESTSLAAYSTP